MFIIPPLIPVCKSRRLRHISFITLSFLVINTDQSSSYPNNVCPTTDLSCSDMSPGSLRPHHLPLPTIFKNFNSNTTINLPNGITRSIATGRVKDANNTVIDLVSADVNFTVMENAVDRSALDRVLDIIRPYDKLDVYADDVDGMPTYELFLQYGKKENKKKGFDSDPKEIPRRASIRRRIKDILDPYLDDVLTPYVRQRFPFACGREGRRCTPCYSIIRRYRHGERQSHETHYDGRTFATVVVSLSDYGIEYRGGLYMSMGYGYREFLALNKGDAVIHQSTFMHGVKVYDLEKEPEKTERWSWILWYYDSEKCDNFAHEWFADCAAEGDALCQQLHAENLMAYHHGDIINEDDEETRQIIKMNQDAAKKGSTHAAVMMAHAHLNMFPSFLPFDYKEAIRYYEMAIQYNCPEAHYGMAYLILALLSTGHTKYQKHNKEEEETLNEVIYHLEAAARSDLPKAMLNLGIAHSFGYGVPQINTTLGAEWYAASGLPEGYYLSSQQAKSANDVERERDHEERARKLGYFEEWRKETRDDFNFPWPLARNGRMPPLFELPEDDMMFDD